ncbi:MAG: hypothetical protein PF636_01090, partial [Actinomycetota bacterium]|nr:hypothetical protein [Actinomycetota bacterium]
MATIVKDMGRGCGRALVIRVVAVAIGVPLGLCGVVSTLLLVTTYDFQPWVLLVTAVLWLAPLFTAGAFLVGSARWRAKKLDALFVPLGLEGEAYMSLFRQYHGAVHGRRTDVYLWRGPYLQIEIATALQTRLGIT